MKTMLLLSVMMIFFMANQAITASTNDSTSINNTDKSDQTSSQPHQKAFTTEASYTGDIITNMMGGIKTGVVFLGMANLKVGFDTQNAKL